MNNKVFSQKFINKDNLAPFFDAFRQEKIAVLCDDAAVPGRSALVSPAQDISAVTVNRLIGLTGGLVFVAMSPARIQSFLLQPMSRPRMTPGSDSFSLLDQSSLVEPGEQIALGISLCESVEAREGVTTGISAYDRAHTISILGEPNPVPRKLVKPGHVFPVEVREGGVLVRNALPEGAVDIVKLAGFTESAAFIDLLDEQGNFLGLEQTRALAEREKLPLITLGELVQLRLQTESLVYRVAEARLPTAFAGELRSVIYKSTIYGGEHLALIKGDVTGAEPVLTRVQAEFTFGDVFGGDTPPTRSQIQRSLKAIGKQGRGLMLYLRRPAGGQLRRQVNSWQSEFKDRAIANIREYGLGAQILRDLKVQRVELLTGSRVDTIGLGTFGIEIVSQRKIPEDQTNP